MEGKIELKFTGFCEGCQHADLCVERLEGFDLFAFKGAGENYYEVTCEHYDKCKEWNEKLKEKKWVDLEA